MRHIKGIIVGAASNMIMVLQVGGPWMILAWEILGQG